MPPAFAIAFLIGIQLSFATTSFSQQIYPIGNLNAIPGETQYILKGKLDNYKLLMFAEGGSHFLNFYSKLEPLFLEWLNKNNGVRTMVLEFGSGAAWLCNKYLTTGDSNFLPKFSSPNAHLFWRKLYEYNQSLPEASKIKVAGIDFESPKAYFKALRSLLPQTDPPAAISKETALIRNSPDTLNCKTFLQIDKVLKRSFQSEADVWKQYASSTFGDMEFIIRNEGSCTDVFKNRNTNMQQRMEQLDALLGDKLYFCVLGEAHTNLQSKNAAWLLTTNTAGPFFNKVAVINTYCDQCTTEVEPVDNWPLKKIEKDIQSKLIPQCNKEFTLFDFTQNTSPDGEKFKAYGQFLLIARNQR